MMPRPRSVTPGSPWPLGAVWDGTGVNFALWSRHATAVDLCLFDIEEPSRETKRLGLTERTDQVWHVRVADIRPTHFARWLHLFRETARQVCPPAAADLFAAKAEMIGQSLQLGIAASRGELPGAPPTG